MSYLRNLIFCCVIVFFVNYLTPGVDVVSLTKLPHIGGDLIVAGGMGLVNFLIGCLALASRRSFLHVGMIILIFNFGAYAALKFLPFGVFTTSVEGYVLAAFSVSIGCAAISYVQARKKRAHHSHHHPDPHEPSEDETPSSEGHGDI